MICFFIIPAFFFDGKKGKKKVKKSKVGSVKGKKGKVVPVLNLIQHYAMKAYGGVDV
jgi:hypothetical protein